MRPVIFLSHITSEAKLADIVEDRVAHDFIGLVRVFASSDQTSILAGSKWLEEVTTALNEATLHVVLASPESITRTWINFEAGAAHVRNVPIVPLCHSGLGPAQLPVPLSESQGLLLSGEGGWERFYRTIASQLGSQLPAVDYAAYGRDVAAFEAEYVSRREIADGARSVTASVEIVRDPRALCISSQQFLQLGIENQLERVLAAFPSDLHHDRVFDSISVRRALTQGRFDIVHIAAFVCHRSGTLYFSDVDLRSGKPDPRVEPDVISADELLSLLQSAETRLAVITSSDSFALASSLLATCHVVAARDMVSPKMMAAWVDAFYNLLPTDSLSQALNFALKVSGAPMRLYARQPKAFDLKVERSVATLGGV